MDPLAEKYYSISLYGFCQNNPVNIIDPDGKSTWVINNSDGTYRIVGGNLKDEDRNIYVYKILDGKLVRDGSIGKTDLMTSLLILMIIAESFFWNPLIRKNLQL